MGTLASQFSGTRPGVTVGWELAADYWPELKVAVAGDTAPDSWRMNGPNLPQWASLGLLDDLTPRFGKAGNTTASRPIVNPLIAQMFDGQLGIRDGVQQVHDQLNAAFERGFK